MVIEGLNKDYQMYGKIFHSIYDGTLAEDWRALITFQQLIVLCDADGIVDMTPASISRRTGIPLEHIEHGLSVLIKPDPSSRTDNEDGCRLLPLSDSREWGWEIVNHKHYRDLRTANDRREYMRNYMKEKRSKQKLTKANDSKQLTKLANTDTDTDTDTDTKIKTRAFSPPSLSEVKEYIDGKNYHVDAEQFIDFYESKGWMVGKNKMKDWKAAVRTWQKRNKENSNGSHQQTSKPSLAERVTENRKRAERQIDEQSLGEDGSYFRP